MGPAGCRTTVVVLASLASLPGSNRQVILDTAHCRSQDEWALPDSNRRSPGYEPSALRPDEAQGPRETVQR